MGNLLVWLVMIPLIGTLFCVPFSERITRQVALGVSLLGLALAVYLFFVFNSEMSAKMQFQYALPWIPSFQIFFALGIDGISFPLVLLTKLMVPIALLASWHEERRLRLFMVNFLLLDFAMTGTFLATDIVLFYVFWEAMLIPMLLLIGIWGSQDRIYAAVKFFLFTFAGSVLMLAAIFWVFGQYHTQFGSYTSNIQELYKVIFPATSVWQGFTPQDLVFWGFALAFLIKVPLFPFHTWLPDAHVQAPTGGSILLAAVLLKMGTYGLLRFAIPLCPDSFARYAPIIAFLSLVGIIYGAWVAFQQTDMKKLVAYSSVSHLGFVVLGLCTLNREGLTGAVLQNINHGLSTGALFFLVGVLYDRRHTRDFNQYGGLAAVLPKFAFFLIFVSCASMAVPGLNGFVGEFLILLGAFKANRIWASTAVLGVIFGALYTLSMAKQILFGPVTVEENKTLKDLYPREKWGLIVLAVFMLWLGLYPQFFLKKIDSALDSYWSGSMKKTLFDAGIPDSKPGLKRKVFYAERA